MPKNLSDGVEAAHRCGEKVTPAPSIASAQYFGAPPVTEYDTMHYVQERSFIATFSTETLGFTGILDSFEGTPRTRQNNWLTVVESGLTVAPQQFWFGYFEGEDSGYQVLTIASEAGASHKDYWDLSSNSHVGYYVTSKKPVLWRVRVDGSKIVQPECGECEGVTLAARGQALLSARERPRWEDHWVAVNAPIKLEFTMNVTEVDVPRFENFAQYRR